MKKESTATVQTIGIRRTFTDFSGEVKKVSHIGPYLAEDAEWICEVTRKFDVNKQTNFCGFPVTKWEVIEWSESLR